jgi:transposase
VKPFVKRHKNDAADAEAICEAARRPNMRFVEVKSEEQQASGLVFRTRDLLVRQRTQTINAIRGHLAEYGWVAPRGPSWVAMLGDLVDGDLGASLPPAARDIVASCSACSTSSIAGSRRWTRRSAAARARTRSLVG